MAANVRGEARRCEQVERKEEEGQGGEEVDIGEGAKGEDEGKCRREANELRKEIKRGRTREWKDKREKRRE